MIDKMSHKTILQSLRNDKTSDPLERKELVSLIKYIDENFSYVNTDMIMKWASDRGHDKEFVKGLLLQLAAYAVDLMTKGRSNEREIKYDRE